MRTFGPIGRPCRNSQPVSGLEARISAGEAVVGVALLIGAVLFVMKKEGTDWRIASLRVLVDLTNFP